MMAHLRGAGREQDQYEGNQRTTKKKRGIGTITFPRANKEIQPRSRPALEGGLAYPPNAPTVSLRLRLQRFCNRRLLPDCLHNRGPPGVFRRLPPSAAAPLHRRRVGPVALQSELGTGPRLSGPEGPDSGRTNTVLLPKNAMRQLPTTVDWSSVDHQLSVIGC